MSDYAIETSWSEEVLFNNHYQCPHCGDEWQDVWSAQVDEDCPGCGLRHISPIQSNEI